MATRSAQGTDIEQGQPVDIRAQGIFKEFGAFPALRGVDIEVGQGELLALLGPSGSGKTTLLRVIAGLEQADRGAIYLGGRDTQSISIQERGVGFVFQSYALFRHMNVFDNIAYGLNIRPASKRPGAAQIRARVIDLLELMQLSGIEKRFPAQLSGGQRQRVALARALAIEPNVLLLDEPFGALDAKVRKELRRWLRDIHQKTGKTTIFVTHDQDEALELAQRVAILNAGRIEQTGTPDDIYDRPASAFVASFVGEAACLDLDVQGGKGALGTQRFDLPAANGRNGAARLFVRPHEAVLGSPETSSLKGTLASLRRTGSGHRAEIALGGVAARLEVEIRSGDVPKPNEIVGVSFAKTHLFFQ